MLLQGSIFAHCCCQECLLENFHGKNMEAEQIFVIIAGFFTVIYSVKFFPAHTFHP
jgi:hypothetical protein